MESMNPGGTGKDRAVKYMLDEARNHPLYHEGVKMFEGTSGSTGIALAFQCNALGLKLHVVMPDDQANEKRIMLEKLGASVSIVPCCAIANANHYVNTARRMAESSGGIFVDQFENAANFRAHFEGTGPEIFRQTDGSLDAFVMSAGTGGTIAGVSKYEFLNLLFFARFHHFLFVLQISEVADQTHRGSVGGSHGLQSAAEGALQCLLHSSAVRAHHPQAQI